VPGASVSKEIILRQSCSSTGAERESDEVDATRDEVGFRSTSGAVSAISSLNRDADHSSFFRIIGTQSKGLTVCGK
jgi:hypothetical protein